MTRPRDANGRFINRETWEMAYALAGQRVPARVGKRNASAPLALPDIERLARQRTRVRTPKPKGLPSVSEKRGAKARPEAAFPRGTEFELTARYKASGKGSRAMLHVKIRVALTAAMTDVQARALLDYAVRTGNVPPGIDVAWLDWQRGVGGEGRHGGSKEGRYDDPGHSELRAFYGPIMASGNARFAKVAESEVEL